MSEQPWARSEGKYVPTSGVPTPAPHEPVALDPEVGATESAELEPVETVEGEDGSTPSHRLLRAIIERVERLDGEIADLRGDRKDVLAEAKAAGFDPKALREVLRRRKMEPDAKMELDALVETYELALGGTIRGMAWGGDLRAQPALPAPKRTDRARKAEEAAALALGARQARLG